MKKKYIKPTVSVYPLTKKPVLLVGSEPGYDDEISYSPRINGDEKLLT